MESKPYKEAILKYHYGVIADEGDKRAIFAAMEFFSASQNSELKKEKADLLHAAESFELMAKELKKENGELKEHIGETKSLNNSYAEKIKRQNERIKSLEEEIDGEEAVSRDRAGAIFQLQSTIEEKDKEISELKYKLAKIKELKDNATSPQELFPLCQYISNNL